MIMLDVTSIVYVLRQHSYIVCGSVLLIGIGIILYLMWTRSPSKDKKDKKDKKNKKKQKRHFKGTLHRAQQETEKITESAV